jgi:hypothetical protein
MLEILTDRRSFHQVVWAHSMASTTKFVSYLRVPTDNHGGLGI